MKNISIIIGRSHEQRSSFFLAPYLKAISYKYDLSISSKKIEYVFPVFSCPNSVVEIIVVELVKFCDE